VDINGDAKRTSSGKYEIERFWLRKNDDFRVLRQNDDFRVLRQNDGMSGARGYCCGDL
jgi:hypothetical protein